MALHNSWRTGHRKIARDAINNIKKNLVKRPSSLPKLPKDPLEWIKNARPIVEGKKRTFQTVPFWREIYLDDHSSKMIIGGRQIYKSTYITDILACEATSAPGTQVGYVTFNQSNLNGFSKQKLQIGTFGQNPTLSKFPRNKLGNIGEISLKNGSTIYCMTDNDQYKHVEGKSLNHCILDEAQYQDIEHLEKIRQTMMATKGKLSVLGIGGESGSAYEELWEKTDQREWIYDDVNWREKLQFDEKGLIIGEYLNDVLKGRWVAQQPENTLYHGYHLPQTIFPTNSLTINDSVNKYHTSPFYSIEYQEKNNSKSFSASHVMGQFYKSERRPITPEMVLSCMNPYRYVSLMKPSDIASKNDNPLSYRRVSDLLVELENSGLVVSRAYSRGRNGYGKEYKLKISPELVGPSIDSEWFDSILRIRASRDRAKKLEKLLPSSSPLRRYSGLFSNR